MNSNPRTPVLAGVSYLFNLTTLWMQYPRSFCFYSPFAPEHNQINVFTPFHALSERSLHKLISYPSALEGG